MSYRIERVEGIGPKYAERLLELGIETTDTLLQRAGTRRGRKALAEEAGVAEKLILRWVNLADLMRINGVGPQFSELLEASGVDTVKELGTRSPDNLAMTLAKVQREKRIARTAPPGTRVRRWILQAKSLDPAVSH
ncbi:MAG: DUF4332 domain-containing protein [Acidobacteriota bacterium]